MLSDISLDGFLCLLEYLYTDYCTLTDIDITMETLILADRLCLPRLVQLCEELIGKILLVMTDVHATELLAFSLKEITCTCTVEDDKAHVFVWMHV